MLGRLFLLFTVVPVVELWLLITIGQHLGAATTVAIVLATGMLGAWLARREGSRVLRAWQQAGQRGEMPKDGFVSSALVLVGGVLLITPGVVTDFVGLVLLVPLTRRAIAKYVDRWLRARFEVQTFVPGAGMFVDLGGGERPPRDEIIDAEVVERPPAEDRA